MKIDNTELKRLCAYKAIDEVVQSGCKIGLGTGSTAEYAVHHLAERIQNKELSEIYAVATSNATRKLCQQVHIPVFSLNDSKIQGQLDCVIDGADELSPTKQLVKGGGGAHLMEKIVAHSTKEMYIVIDESKLVTVLNRAFPIPLEIIPEARMSIQRQLRTKGYSVELRMDNNAQPTITDNGNQILDLFVPHGEGMMVNGPYDPSKLEVYFNTLPGVLESGIFTCPVTRVYIGTTSGVITR